MNKKTVSLTIVLVVLFTIFVYEYLTLGQSLTELNNEIEKINDDILNVCKNINDSKEELDALSYNLEKENNSLQENLSELNSLRSGDSYNLHDPTWAEVVEFLDNNMDINETNELIDLSKSNGIRCAYVEVITGDVMFRLIGFNTLDYGMQYIEIYSHFSVNPELGSYYYNCFEDMPYDESLPYDEYLITDMIVMW